MRLSLQETEKERKSMFFGRFSRRADEDVEDDDTEGDRQAHGEKGDHYMINI